MNLRDLTTPPVVALTCVVLLDGAATLRAQTAVPEVPEQLRPAPRLILPDLWPSPIAPADGRGAASPDHVPETFAQQSPAWVTERRACDGCPSRSVGRSLLQATMINVIYEAANLIRGQVTARITPKTWWDNMEQGWVWDLDDFAVNQIGHPYQGSNYFNAGRANGLSYSRHLQI